MLVRVHPGRGRLLRPAGASVLRLRRSNRLAADARSVVLFGADRGVGIDLVTGQVITAVSSPRHIMTEDGPALNNAAGYGSLAHDASLDITGDITVAIRARALSADANFVDKVGGGSGATNTPFYLAGSLSGLYFVRSNSGYVAWQSNTAGLRTDRVQALSVVSQNINTAPTAYFDGVSSTMTLRFTNGGAGTPTGNSNPVLLGNGSANYLNMAVLGARLWSESEQNQFLYDWAALVEDAPLYHFFGVSNLNAYTMPLSHGAFTLSGQDAALRVARRLPLANGAINLSGQAAALRADRKLALANGSFALTGQDATMRRGRRMVIDAGTFSATGQDLSLLVGRRITLSRGDFTLTGQVVDFIAGESQPGGYLVIEVLSGTFQDGEILTGNRGGSGQADGTVIFADYLFDLAEGSMMTMPSGELLQAGASHNGALHAARLETVADVMAFGDVWAYNLKTASGDWATGAGRITFNNHIGPGNALFPDMLLRNQHMDAFAGNGGVAGEGTWEDQGFTGPADGIGLDFSAHSDEGNAPSSRGLVPYEQLISADATVFRTAGKSSLKLEVNQIYTGGTELRIFLPVIPGKIVLPEFFYSKPEEKPARAHGPYTSGLPEVGDTIYVSTTAGRSLVTIEDKHAQWIGGSGPRAGWTVTLANVTGNPGGIPNAVWNATHTVVERLDAFLFSVDLGAGNEADTSASIAGGAAIEATYSQTSVFIYVRNFWARRGWFDQYGRPVVTQAQYQGEKNIEVTLAPHDWTPWRYATWYAENAIPDTPTERVARGRAPEWATHYMLVLNWQNIREADLAAPPAFYLTDFYANVI